MSVQKFIDESRVFFKEKQFDKAEQRLKQAWQEIIGEATQVQIQEQNDVRYWLGRCSFEKAQRIEKNEKVIQLLKEAIKYFQQQLSLAKKLCNTQTNIKEQNYAYNWLGLCYLEQAIREKLSIQQIHYFIKLLEVFIISWIFLIDWKKKRIVLKKRITLKFF